ncbi:hypothetical protein ACPCAJ_21000 [Streptomyces griseoincarnatus]
MAFPQDPLGTKVEFQIGSTWTDVTEHALLKDVITHTRGRTGEGQAVDPASCTLTLRSPDGLYSWRNPRSPYYGLLNKNTPMKVSVAAGPPRLWLPEGQLTARAETPSVTALNVTGSIDVRMDMQLRRRPGQFVELCGKYAITGNQRSWALLMGVDEKLWFRRSTDGTTITDIPSTAAVPVPPSGRIAVRVTWNAANGVVTFYTASTMAGPWTQLGAASSPGSTTATFASTVPVQVGDISVLGLQPPDGAILAFQLRSGIGGTAVADVDFTAQTAGATSFTDAAGRVWSVLNGAEISARRPIFTGEYSDWPPRWDRAGQLITIDGEAAGILRRLNQGKKALQSTLRRRIPSYNPVAYWPMEEGTDATSVYSPVEGVAPFTPRAFDFAADDTLAGSGPLPVVQPNASFLAQVPAMADGTWQVELVYRLDQMPVAETTLLQVRSTGTARQVEVRIQTNLINFIGLDTNGSTVFSNLATAPEFTGGWNRLQIMATQSGGNVTYLMRWIVINSLSYTISSTVAAVPGRVVDIRSSFGAGLDGMSLGHLAVFTGGESLAFNSADHGFNQERAAARLARLGTEEGLPVTVLGSAADTAEMGPQRSGTLLELLEECAQADGGLLVEDRTRPGLVYRTRASLYNQTPKLTLSYRQPGLGELEPIDDDSNLRNDVTVHRTGGSTGRAELTSGPLSVEDPPAGVGRYDESTDLNLYSDAQAEPMAWWLLHLGTVDEARYPTITIRLHRAPELIPAVLDLVEGDLIRLTDLPTWLPPGPVDLIVQGLSEEIGVRTWTVSLVCAPGSPWRVGVVGDTETGRADTDGSQLAAPLGEADTTLTVTTTAGPAWITTATHASDFPFDVVVGGELMTVTGISGASSPQTFTVTRSVNGIVKEHAAGASVRVHQPFVFAL